MAFLDESTWRGKVFSGGWKAAAGGEAPVIEPATCPPGRSCRGYERKTINATVAYRSSGSLPLRLRS